MKEDENKDKPRNETNTHFVSKQDHIGLLQTATTTVSDTSEKHSTTLRILFDSGSQLSYITPRGRKLLKLPTCDTSEILLKTFGNKVESKSLEKVTFCVKTTSGAVYVNAFVSDISTPLTGQFIDFTQQSYPHLKYLQLADSNPNAENLEIDILIGTDYNWTFLSGKVIKSPNGVGPAASDSSLGFILSGRTKIPLNYSTNLNLSEICAFEVDSEIDVLKKIWDTEKDLKDEENKVFT